MSAPAIKKQSKKPVIGHHLPFLNELLSLNDKNTRKAKAQEHCSQLAEARLWKGTPNGFDYLPKYKKYGGFGEAGSHISCVFGGFDDSWEKYHERHPTIWANTVRCGIEILSAEPNATGSTYSNKCRITVKELKEACKANGIKPTGDKKALLSALMKI